MMVSVARRLEVGAPGNGSVTVVDEHGIAVSEREVAANSTFAPREPDGGDAAPSPSPSLHRADPVHLLRNVRCLPRSKAVQILRTAREGMGIDRPERLSELLPQACRIGCSGLQPARLPRLLQMQHDAQVVFSQRSSGKLPVIAAGNRRHGMETGEGVANLFRDLLKRIETAS
jgi:hypothetical protein